MQVILDSLFARSGSAPIWGEKKGEFRDWTSHGLCFVINSKWQLESVVVMATMQCDVWSGKQDTLSHVL